VTLPVPELFSLVRGHPPSLVTPETELVHSAAEHRLIGLLALASRDGRIKLSKDCRRNLAVRELSERTRLDALESGLEAAAAAAPGDAQLVVMKGLGLHHQHLAQRGVRPASDVDLLLLNPEPSVLERLLAEWGVPAQHRAATIELVATRQLQHLDIQYSGIWIDLHFDVLKIGPWVKDTEVLTATSGPVESVAAPCLGPEIELVALATHLNKDRFAYLGYYLDIGAVSKTSGLDWDLLRGFVAGEGLEVPVFKTLHRVARALESEPPPVPDPSGLRARCWERLWPESEQLAGHAGRVGSPRRQWLLPFMLRGRMAEALTDFRRRVLPSAELIQVQRPQDQRVGRLRTLTLDRVRRYRESASKRR